MFTNELLEDLESIWETDFILRARDLNKQLGNRYFNEYMLPFYYIGNPQAETVMVMLNPGADKENYRFSETDKASFRSKKGEAANLIELFLEHTKYAEEFGEIEFNSLDNFDLKQAAFLHGFSNLNFEIPRLFWHDLMLKRIAKRNVMMGKLQLEFIPYASREFPPIMDTYFRACANYVILEPYLVNLLDAIIQFPRTNILFCSKQFLNLLNASRQLGSIIDSLITGPLESLQVGKLTLRYTNLVIVYKNTQIKGGIVHSFANQALPNAFEKMAEYGTFCYSKLHNNSAL